MQNITFHPLVRSLEGWYSMTLLLIQSIGRHSPVSQVDIALWLFLEAYRMLHPILVVSFGEVLSSVRPS